MDLLAVELHSHLVRGRDQIRVDLHVHLIVIVVILPVLAFHVLFVTVVTSTRVSLIFPLVRVVIITVSLHLLLLLVQGGCLLETLLINVVLLIVDPAVAIVIVFNLVAVLIVDHPLAVQLLLSHLIEAILFIVSVRHDSSDQF